MSKLRWFLHRDFSTSTLEGELKPHRPGRETNTRQPQAGQQHKANYVAGSGAAPGSAAPRSLRPRRLCSDASILIIQRLAKSRCGRRVSDLPKSLRGAQASKPIGI